MVVAGQGWKDDEIQALGGDGDGPREFAALLKREPYNRYDPNAILVLVAGVKVGYVPRERAKRWAAGLDRHGDEAVCGLLATRRPTRSRAWRVVLLVSYRKLTALTMD